MEDNRKTLVTLCTTVPIAYFNMRNSHRKIPRLLVGFLRIPNHSLVAVTNIFAHKVMIARAQLGPLVFDDQSHSCLELLHNTSIPMAQSFKQIFKYWKLLQVQ